MDDKRIGSTSRGGRISSAAHILPGKPDISGESNQITIIFEDHPGDRAEGGEGPSGRLIAKKAPKSVTITRPNRPQADAPPTPVNSLAAEHGPPGIPNGTDDIAQSDSLRGKASPSKTLIPDEKTSPSTNLLSQTNLYQNVEPERLFDERWYRECCQSANPVSYEHYLQHGIPGGISPSPLFDTAYYLTTWKEVDRRNENPVEHYLKTPVSERTGPHPLFDRRFYAAREPRLPPEVDPFLHYIFDGKAITRQPHPLFDPIFYICVYPEVLKIDQNPLRHYVARGQKEGRTPHPLFNVSWYLAQTGDPEAKRSPLQHYLEKGGAAGLSPHPLFDSAWYLSQTGDADAARAPLKHYIQKGSAAGISPHPLFNPGWYRRTQMDDAEKLIDPLSHFITIGDRKGRDPNPLFSTRWYREQNRDVAKIGINALLHYLQFGANEMRDPHPAFSTASYLRRNPECRTWRKVALVHALEKDRPSGAPIEFSSRIPVTSQLAEGKGKLADTPVSGLKAVSMEPHRRYLAEIIEWEAGEAAAQRVLTYFKIIDKLDVGGSTSTREERLRILLARMRSLSSSMGSEHDPDVTVIIPAFNHVEYTIACVLSLFEHRSRVNYEVLIGNNISFDETRELFKSVGGVVKCITHAINEGFIRNCNLSARYARGRYIVLLNNDTFIIDGWLDALIEPFKTLDRIGLVGSKLLSSDGHLQEAGGIMWNDANAWNYGRGKDPRASEFNYLKDIDYISGASIAIPTAVWLEIGGFDERYVPAYFDDSDLAFGLRSLGYRTLYQPASVLVHHEGITHGTEVSSGVKAYQVANKAKFIDKWRDALDTDQFPDGQSVFFARDRSRRKPHILFVDHYVPQFDKDAGSRTIYEYVMLFVKSGFQVTFWPENLFYDRAYVRVLQALGCEVLYGSEYAGGFDHWLNESGQFFDYALLSRAHIADQFINSVKQHKHIRVLYYGHDIAFLRLQMQMEIDPNPQAAHELERFEVLERAMWDKSDVIYYPADFECEFVARERPDRVVRLFPAYLYDEAAIADARRRVSIQKADDQKSAIFVAGFRHAPNADAATWLGREIWPRVLERVPDAVLYIAGSFPPPEVQALADRSIKVTGFISDDILEVLYQKAHVCVAPLRYGGGVKRKVIEGMQFGLPVVTTTVGAQGLKNPDEFLSVADDAAGFAESIIEILLDRRLGMALAGKAVTYLAEHFSVEYARRLLAADIPELAAVEPLAPPTRPKRAHSRQAASAEAAAGGSAAEGRGHPKAGNPPGPPGRPPPGPTGDPAAPGGAGALAPARAKKKSARSALRS